MTGGLRQQAGDYLQMRHDLGYELDRPGRAVRQFAGWCDDAGITHVTSHQLITGFLRHLETDRGSSLRTRNARLAAIHSLFRYAELHAPDDADAIRRVLVRCPELPGQPSIRMTPGRK